MKKFRLSLIAVALACILPFASSSSVFADELSINVYPVDRQIDYPSITAMYGSCSDKVPSSGYIHNPGTTAACSFLGFDYNLTKDWGVNEGNIFKLVIFVYDLRDKEEINMYINEPYTGYAHDANGTLATASIIGQKAWMMSESSAQVEYYFRFYTAGYHPKTMALNPHISLAPNEYARFGGLYVYRIQDYTVNMDTQSIVDAINNTDNAQAINSQTQKIEQQTQEIKNQTKILEETRDAQETQATQQQEQYEQEKQEEQEREEAGKESADELGGIFSFSVINPFSSILALFTDGGSCVSIPQIAEMLHSESTQYCPWFPASVRSVLTPVIGMSSTIILFGFIVRWLQSSSFNGSISNG